MPRRAFDCPHCGERVPAGARACPECGSDAGTGWSDDADAWAGDLPTGYGDDEDDDFDEQEFLREEGLAGDGVPSRRRRARQRTTIVVLVLIACLLLWLARM